MKGDSRTPSRRALRGAEVVWWPWVVLGHWTLRCQPSPAEQPTKHLPSSEISQGPRLPSEWGPEAGVDPDDSRCTETEGALVTLLPGGAAAGTPHGQATPSGAPTGTCHAPYPLENY